MGRLIRDYSVPMVLALLLHGLIGFIVHEGQSLGITPERSVIVPKALKTTLVELARIEDLPTNPEFPTPEPVLEEPVKPSPIAQNNPEQTNVPEPLRDPLEETEKEKKARLEAERQARKRELARKAFSEAVESEAQKLKVEDEGDIASIYANAIYSQIVVNWSRPPSARNFMSATLRVELFPNGELNTVEIEESSGDSAFDRSALLAVRKVKRFHVPSDTALFEARFRQFRLRFRPEDLLR